MQSNALPDFIAEMIKVRSALVAVRTVRFFCSSPHALILRGKQESGVLLAFQYQKNPRAHKNKIGTSPPQSQNTPPPC